MYLWRKPATGQWYYESAKCVDEVEVTAEGWTGQTCIHFDGTKNKRGGRHTDLRLVLSESEVERLYQGLTKGRKAEIRRLERLEKQVGELTTSIRVMYLAAGYGTEKKKVLRRLWNKLREL